MIGLRRRHRWLHQARTTPLHRDNRQLSYAAAGDGRRLVVALNLADAPAPVPAAGAGELLAGAGTVRGSGTRSAVVELAPHGWAVLDG